MFCRQLCKRGMRSPSMVRWQHSGEQLSHIRAVQDDNFMPCMVDVSEKAVTSRIAHARGKVFLPKAVTTALDLHKGHKEINAKKGPVFATAIVAGVMAVKKTSDLIPFCHPIPIDKCDILLDLQPYDCQEDKAKYDIDYVVHVDCIVKTSGKTGVEMEALNGVSSAALCIYDMLKAVSHDIRIGDIHLVAKTGGKSDYKHPTNKSE